jgi:ABC-2 type transport system ATP-binding protein
MKQMVKLAQAIVHGPRLLMLDEPTNGLDPPARKRMLDLVRDIRDRGETASCSRPTCCGDVETVCDEVLILKAGRIADSCDLEAERRANRSLRRGRAAGAEPAFADRGRSISAARSRSPEPPAQAGDARRRGRARPVSLADRLGVGIRRLDLKRDSLQDIFLRAMEGRRGGV